MQWEGPRREGSRHVSYCVFAFSSPSFLNDSSFHENTSCGEHMAWQRAPSGICLGTLWDTTSIDGYFYTLIYGSEMKRRTQIEGDQTCSLSKTSHGGIRGWMEALQRAGYETEVTGCDKKKGKERLLLHPVGIGHVCSRDDDSAPARQRSRVSWRVKGTLDGSERMQIRDRNEMSHIRNVSISIGLAARDAS